MTSPGIVPLHESGIPYEKDSFTGSTITISEGRTITVGVSCKGKYLIVIERPIQENNRSQLKFSLSNEAAIALLTLLHESLLLPKEERTNDE